ncbi:MAG: VWA domain-containing protein [Balneolaceae bacterium]|nr:VWA domain-containing protein [Balneolaceae bacterium]MBO6547336.1 VWA domain-containing protein [Balneolaceae bacterium]MBO6647717.1 VWA domain-containing protein [Balneolaceae bacterium]
MRYICFIASLLVFSACAGSYYPSIQHNQQDRVFDDEDYDQIIENSFIFVYEAPLSTFSIDVDGASYSNVRRMITDGYLPPSDAVRIEEMINYFNYNYPGPKGNNPFSVHTEIAPAPWNPEHHLVQIGIQGERVEAENLPPSNLVFLLDVSGSMGSYDKLPLLKKGFKLLVNQLREEDYVSIVVYAGSSGLVLPPTSGYDKETILESLDKLQSGGSTAGAAGIQQAYQVAMENFRENANNRVILATDGDFNVGVSNDEALVELIEKKREHGIFLSVLGFGTGNLKDSKMEKIANHGNGNYYYIDNLLEAKKVLVSEMGGTLHTIAKDVKVQVEFNPQNVQAYRLIGYENRLLADEDFNDDKKDAGELGSGHTVTALYEVIPVGIEIDNNLTDIDPLKYQTPTNPVDGFSDEIMTVKLRYKQPDGDSSKLISRVINKKQVNTELSENLSFAASVASFGMLLRDSRFKGSSSFEMVNQLAKNGKGEDDQGYRAEFIKIAELADLLWQGQSKN